MDCDRKIRMNLLVVSSTCLQIVNDFIGFIIVALDEVDGRVLELVPDAPEYTARVHVVGIDKVGEVVLSVHKTLLLPHQTLAFGLHADATRALVAVARVAPFRRGTDAWRGFHILGKFCDYRALITGRQEYWVLMLAHGGVGHVLD